jgi:plasmid stabilization system protein ParE
MIVEWRPAAVTDLDKVISYLEDHNPQAAYQLSDAIIKAGISLAELPNRGRPGRLLGTRELVSVFPYILVYEVDEAAKRTTILRLWHAAQDR